MGKVEFTWGRRKKNMKKITKKSHPACMWYRLERGGPNGRRGEEEEEEAAAAAAVFFSVSRCPFSIGQKLVFKSEPRRRRKGRGRGATFRVRLIAHRGMRCGPAWRDTMVL